MDYFGKCARQDVYLGVYGFVVYRDERLHVAWGNTFRTSSLLPQIFQWLESLSLVNESIYICVYIHQLNNLLLNSQMLLNNAGRLGKKTRATALYRRL